MLTIICPECGKQLKISEKYLGEWGTCKHCKNRIQVVAPPVKFSRKAYEKNNEDSVRYVDDSRKVLSQPIEHNTIEYGLRKCPFCAEMIKREALICKHCKSTIRDVQFNAEETNESMGLFRVNQPQYPPAYSYIRDPQTLTSFLIMMLCVYLAFEVLSLLSNLGQLALIQGIYTEAEAEANDIRQGIIGLGDFVIFIITAIVFLKWTYRANLNCRGFGAKGMRFTPGWSIGWYFIPIANLSHPYEAMKEIWKVSHNPEKWNLQKGGALLGWWWGLWLATNISANAALFGVDDLQVETYLYILSAFIGIPQCLVAIFMIKTIAHKQNQLVANSRPHYQRLN